MYRIKLCMGLRDDFGIPYEEQIRLMRQVGFDGFFVKWPADIAALRRVADEEGMLFQSVHAPIGKIADMWEPDDRADAAVAELIACLGDCAANAVPIMVAHAFVGFDRHEPTLSGVEHFAQVVAEAERLQVRIAFENTEGSEYLAALMERFRDNPWVGFCWDTGHELCYSRGEDVLALYGDRLLCTHLNDNLGVRDYTGRITSADDLHLLPFDGIADWQDIAARLNRHGFRDCLTFELKIASKKGRRENDGYARMAIEDYVTQAYMRACRVGAMVLRG